MPSAVLPCTRAHSIAIVIARLFMHALVHCGMHADDVIVTVRFVGVDNRLGVSELMHLGFQGFASRVRDNAQTDMTALPPNRSYNRRTIIVVGSTPTLLVRSTTRRIQGIRVLLAFSPAC